MAEQPELITQVAEWADGLSWYTRAKVARLLGGEGHPGHGSGQDLQVDLGTDGLADALHGLERILAQVEQGRLKAGSPAELEVVNAHLHRGLQGG